MRALVTLFALLASIEIAAADDPNQRYVVSGRGMMFAIAQPPGWQMDNTAGANNGLPVVLYPIDKTWTTADTVIYANTAPKACEPTPDLQSFVDADLKKSKARNPKLVIKDGASTMADGYSVMVKTLKGDRHGNVEAIAYVNSKDTFVSFVLSAKSQKDFASTYPMFRTLVESYQLVASAPGCI